MGGRDNVETEGTLTPETVAEARAEYESLVPAAKAATREAAKAMSFDRAEYDERVTPDVIASVRDALFVSLLTVHVGSREAFETWREDHPGYETVLAGSGNAECVVWHAPPFADRAVAATFNEERGAAVGTLRRQAFGRLYRDRLPESDDDSSRGDDTSDDLSESDDASDDDRSTESDDVS